MSEVILFCFESICFQSPSYNTDKGTQTISLWGEESCLPSGGVKLNQGSRFTS